MKPRLLIVAAGFFLFLFLPIARVAAQPEYDVVLIEYEGPGVAPFNMIATAINEAGVVVGSAQFSSPTFTTRAWIWNAVDGMQLLPLPPGADTAAANDINESGVIVGDDAYEIGPGWIYQNGQFTSIGTLGTDSASSAAGINSTGQVCGTSQSTTITSPDHAIRYEAGTGLIDLTPTFGSRAVAINEAGQIAGSTLGNQAFRWTPGVGIEPLGPLSSVYPGTFARDINASGQVTGFGTSTGTSSRRAFLYTDGIGMLQLPTPGGDAFAWGMNDFAEVVGESDTPATAWIWSAAGGVRDLSALIDPALDLPLILATDINNMGMVVATGTDQFTPTGFVARVAVLYPTGAGSVDGPTALACDAVIDTVTLEWSLPMGYDTIEVVRDGAVVAQLGGTETEFVDTSVPLGHHTYRVRGQVGGSVSDARFCAVEVDGLLPAPESIACTATGSTVDLSWIAPIPFDTTQIYRDGVLIAALGSGVTMFSDTGVATGIHEYEIIGEIGGASSAPATCSLVVASGSSVLVYSPPGATGVDAVAAELSSAGISFVQIDDFGLVDPSSFEAMFAVFGVNPAAIPMTVAEGQMLADFVTAGGALYIEGGDIWGTSSVTPFHQIDGIYSVFAGGSFAVDEVTGQDGGAALDLSGFGSVPYSGPDQSLDWLGADSPLARPIWKRSINDVNLGMFYAPPTQGPIIECSFQLGGITDPVTRSEIFGAYLSALQVGVAPPAPEVRRGDVNGDTLVDISDPIALLAYLFQSGAPLPCDDAADVNDDGALSIADPVSILASLFGGGVLLGGCAEDSTADALSCLTPSCP